MRLGGDRADRNDLPAPQMSLYISPKALTEHNNAIGHVLGPNSAQEHQRQLWIQGLYVLVNAVGCFRPGLNVTCAMIGESDISRPSVSRGWRQRRGERERAKQPDAINDLQAFYKSSRNPMGRHLAPRHRPAKAISVGRHGPWLNGAEVVGSKNG